MKWILLAHIFATLYMVGLIWFVQLVHYPLFSEVGLENSIRYSDLHQKWTTWAVGPPMLVEIGTAIWLLRSQTLGISSSLLWAGMILLGIIWLSTAILQVPAHEALSKSFDPKVHSRLVNTNWIRTFAWTARGVLVLMMVAPMISIPSNEPKKFVGSYGMIRHPEEGEAKWLAKWDQQTERYNFVAAPRQEGETYWECINRDLGPALSLKQGKDYIISRVARLHVHLPIKLCGETRETFYVAEFFVGDLYGKKSKESIEANNDVAWIPAQDLLEGKTEGDKKIDESLVVLLNHSKVISSYS